MTATEKIQKARAGLIYDQPFFASLALRLLLVEDRSIKTAGTNGKVLKFNPEWIDSLSLDQTKGMLAHEVLHIGNCHHTRRGGRDVKLWNKAADYAINDVIIQCGLVLPDGTLTGMGTDKSAEQLYNMLYNEPPEGGGGGGGGGGQGQQQQQQPPQQGQQPGGQNQPQPGNQPGQQPGQSQGNQPGNDPGSQGGQGDQDGQSQGQGQDQGQDNDPGGCGGIEDAPGKDGQAPTQADLDMAEQEAKIGLSQAAQQAKACGKLPGALERFVKDIIDPKVDWRVYLRDFIERASRNDYTWMEPNRRHVMNGIYLPSLKSKEIGEVVVSVDTSGSVGNHDLQQFISEVNSILEEYDTTIHLLPVDHDVHDPKEYTQDDLPLVAGVTGGGGTSFVPPFLHVERNGITPCCMVYLTDGYCDDYPREIPDYPVLWVSSQRKITPPFGEVIMINS